MKRIYLTGAAIILLVLLAVSYYNVKSNNSPAPQAQSQFTANTIFPDEALHKATAVDNAPAKPVTDNTPLQIAASYTCRPRHAAHKHRNISRAGEAVADVVTPRQAAEPTRVVLNTDVRFEATNEYYGNRPADYTSYKVTHRTSHRHSAHRRGSGGHMVQFGPEIGFNQNGMSHNDNESNMGTGNFHAGINVSINLGDHVALQPGVRFISRGNRTESTLDVSTREKIKLNYLELPANIVFKIGEVGNARVTLGAGPYVAWLVGSHHTFSNTPDGSVSDALNPAQPVYNTDNIDRFDWGLGGFVGCESPDGFYFKAGYEHGLKDILSNPATGNSSNRNYSYLVSVGYLFGGYKK